MSLDNKIAITCFDPLVSGTSNLMLSLTNRIASAGFGKTALVGYDDAQISVSINRLEANDWIMNGLGRHIEFAAGINVIKWEGFVNEIKLVSGGREVTIGPLLDIGNRVSVVYSPVDYDTSPPTVGATTFTTLVDDDFSQSIYGIIEKVVSGGRVTDDEAETIRDTFLEENRYPKTNNNLNFPPSSNITLELSCLGYYHWLDHYVYTNLTPGYTNISTRIAAILDANPNTDMFSSSYQIESNAHLIPSETEDNQTGLSQINTLLAIGDSSDYRYKFGCYADRVFKYESIPDDLKYFIHTLSNSNTILDKSQRPVALWDVEPGYWGFITDSMQVTVPEITIEQMKKDNRFIFIESLKYQIPGQLNLNGGLITTFGQKLARFTGAGSY